MARYIVNFSISVEVESDVELDQNGDELGIGDDIIGVLGSDDYNAIVDDAIANIDTDDLSGNIDSIERVE